jgi:hypothetical protein
MSSTYSSSLRAELIGSGDQAGAWGTTTNNNFNYIFDVAIAGYQAVTIASTPYTLTSVSGPTSTAALNQSVYAAIRFTGATGATTVFAPAVTKTYIIWNDSGHAVTLYNTGYTTGPTIAVNAKVLVFSDGLAFYEVSPQTVAGVATVATGGTGVTTSTGTGSTVLSASPTFTGTVGAAAITASGTVQGATITSTGAVSASTTVADSKGNVRTIVQNAQAGSYTLVAADAGKHVSTSAGVIIPASIFATGEAITIYNNSASAITITCSAVTAYKASVATAITSVTLVARGICTVLFYGSNAAVISGTI